MGDGMATDRRRLLASLVALGTFTALLSGRSAQAQSVAYTYDVLGRLKTVTYPDGRVTTYTYDVADNRTQVTTGTPPPPPPLAASVSGTFFEGGISSDAGPANTTASGGVPPYAYLWERLSGATTTVAATPTDASTTWYYTGTPVGPPKVTTWRCKVTDSASTVAYTATVTVRMQMS